MMITDAKGPAAEARSRRWRLLLEVREFSDGCRTCAVAHSGSQKHCTAWPRLCWLQAGQADGLVQTKAHSRAAYHAEFPLTACGMKACLVAAGATGALA